MPAAKKVASSIYDVHPSLGMYQSSLAALKQKTGRTLEEWIMLVQKSGPATEKDRRAWLKAEHGLGMNYAGWIAEHSVGKGDDGNPETYLRQAEEFIQNMFSGDKESLLPIYNELLSLGRSLGNDVKVCPGKTIVPLYRKHVFAQIKPTTRARIDLGLALKDTKVPKRLIDTGGLAKKDRITHRIEITSLKGIDGEVKKWLKIAYEMDR
ncbi:MAG TPA: DUF5655 domain-containing protein [Blattabacteriaceae bacterium]|jgi:hypothetical protein|nr:DUF5655 domain-containing protein [Blattabacteriaceae bacterium]